MSEAKKEPANPDGKGEGSPDGKGDNQPQVTMEQFTALQAQLSTMNDELKKVVTQRDELKKEKKTVEQQKAAADGDIEALRRSYETETSELQAKLEQLNGQLRVNLLENEVKRTLSEVSTDPDVAYLLLQEQFELVEIDGRMKPRVKNNVADVKVFAERKLEEMGKTYLLKNTRKKGTDTKGPEGTSKASAIPADFNNWGYDQKREWMKNNPHLAAEAAVKALGG